MLSLHLQTTSVMSMKLVKFSSASEKTCTAKAALSIPLFLTLCSLHVHPSEVCGLHWWGLELWFFWPMDPESLAPSIRTCFRNQFLRVGGTHFLPWSENLTGTHRWNWQCLSFFLDTFRHFLSISPGSLDLIGKPLWGDPDETDNVSQFHRKWHKSCTRQINCQINLELCHLRKRKTTHARREWVAC